LTFSKHASPSISKTAILEDAS